MVISGLIMGLPYHLDEHCYPETTRVRFAMHRKILNLINFLQKFNFLQMPQFCSLTSAQPSVAAAHLLRLEISPNFTSYYTFYFPALHICTFAHFQKKRKFLFQFFKSGKIRMKKKETRNRDIRSLQPQSPIKQIMKCLREIEKIKDGNSTYACFLEVEKQTNKGLKLVQVWRAELLSGTPILFPPASLMQLTNQIRIKHFYAIDC